MRNPLEFVRVKNRMHDGYPPDLGIDGDAVTTIELSMLLTIWGTRLEVKASQGQTRSK